MRILLDECVDRKLKRYITGHDVSTVADAGWRGKQNGELLALVPSRFDAFVTMDRNLHHQQNLARLSFPVFLLIPEKQQLAFLVHLVPQLLEALDNAPPGKVTIVTARREDAE